MPFSIGLHPWNDAIPQWMGKLEALLAEPQCVLLGECGIDKLHGPEMVLQKENLLKQIRLAEQYRKPMILHCVRAYNELFTLRKELRPTMPWIIHGYRGSLQMAMQLTGAGFTLSFGDYITHTKTAETIKVLGSGNLFLETDESSTPISEIYQSAAKILEMSLDQLEADIETLYHRTIQ